MPEAASSLPTNLLITGRGETSRIFPGLAPARRSWRVYSLCYKAPERRELDSVSCEKKERNIFWEPIPPN